MGKRQKGGKVKQILNDHFDEFWQLHHDRFPSDYQADI